MTPSDLKSIARQRAARLVDPVAFTLLEDLMNRYRLGRENDPWAVFFECSHRGLMLHQRSSPIDLVMQAYETVDRVAAIMAAAEVKTWSTQDPPMRSGLVISVRSETAFRWKPYKPDGARQMRKAGRWQAADEHGRWSNAELYPGAEWRVLHDGK